ncbi:MAG: MoxR family ATPase [Planctomycetota bacterium]|nr:MoxR family ATPase [Planctomycetota bacterium]
MPEDAFATAKDLDFDGFQQYAQRLRESIAGVVVGQRAAVEQLLIASLCGGHTLMVGVPGLAKTLLVRTLAHIFAWKFRRIQFTPDLMPADITGYELLVQAEGAGRMELSFRRGPVFANLVLADEINRAPPKTQSALLEAMQEHRVTVGGETHKLDEPFLVIATQNPIEQEGTYPLPEAQLDRFFFEVRVEYPGTQEEEAIVTRTSLQELPMPEALFDRGDFLGMQRVVRSAPMPPSVVSYCVALSQATRPAHPKAPQVAKKYIEWGAGPRASQTLLNAAKARALLEGRPTPTAADVAAIALPTLRHRVIPNYHAVGEGLGADAIVGKLVEAVPAPKG